MGRIDLKMELERGDESATDDSAESDDQVTMESESTDIYKDYDLYLAVKNGNLNDFTSILDLISAAEHISFGEILSRVSPIGNTFLHVAAIHGNEDIVNYIAAKDPSIVLQKNFNGDTALHLAAKAGDESMVKVFVLIHHDLLGLHIPEYPAGTEHDIPESPVGAEDDIPECPAGTEDIPESTAGTEDDISESPVGTEDETNKNNLLRAKNERGNTALHEALIHGRESIVQYLIKEDPELVYYRNKQGIYGLYLAAEAGFVKCVSSILEYSTDHERVNDQFKKKSPIEAAIVNRKRDVLKAILDSSPRFIKLQDGQGRTPLHYAASSGYVEGVRYLLKRHASSATRRDKSGSFPIHLAAIEGHVDIISLLLNYHPADPVELLDKNGKNILHLAAKNGKLNVVIYILHNPKLKELINMSDKDGNKPLHLASINWHPEIVSVLTWDKRVDIKLSNDKGMTALDAANCFMGHNPPFRQRLTWAALKAAGTPRRHGNFRPSSGYTVEKYKERVNTLLLVSTLVATITFTAGFTLPGGLSISDTNLGMAAMLRKKAFHIFIFCDTIAMYSSIVVAVSLIWAQLGDLRFVLKAVTIAQPLLVIALTMMSMAFTAGIFLVVRNLHWLSIVVLVMGLAFLLVLLVLLIPLCMTLTSSNRIIRYVSYYPFWLLMFATRT